ncbi:MAG TPA: TolC family protein [Polyangia bacterium]|nr:TolC family protein [Polyangia bacterium]
MVRPLLLLLAAVASPAPAPALSPPVQLRDLLEEARRKNPEIAAVEEQAHAAEAAAAGAGALDDPMLMVQLWNMPVDLSTVPLMVNLTQPLPLGGKRQARRDEARASADASRADIATRSRDIENQIARAYFDLYLADRTLEVEAEIARNLETLVAAASSRVAAGRGEAAEVLRAEGEALKLQSDREAAVGRRAAAGARLVALLDRPPGSEIGRTAEPGVLADLPPADELRARALHDRPELRVAGAAARAAEARRRLADAESVPDLALSAGEMHMFRSDSHPADFLFLGVQANLPIFSGKNRARVAESEARVAVARAETRALENRIVADVADAFAEVQAETRQAQLHHQLIPLARQAVSSALASYAAGRGTFAGVLDAARDLQMHELDLAQHLAAYAQRLADLERAVGSDVGLVRMSSAGTHAGHEEVSP